MPEQTPNDLDLYGRLENGVLVEFPVYYFHIQNRAHPVEWYTPAIVEPAEPAPPYHANQEKVEVRDGKIYVTYEAVPLTLEQLLQSIYADVIPAEGQEPAVYYQDVDPALAARVYTLAGNYTMEKLNAFVQTRNYDSMLSLVSYKDSQIPQFAAEAARGLALRDQIWAAQMTFFQNMVAGTAPVPRSILEIDAMMPELTWD